MAGGSGEWGARARGQGAGANTKAEEEIQAASVDRSVCVWGGGGRGSHTRNRNRRTSGTSCCGRRTGGQRTKANMGIPGPLPPNAHTNPRVRIVPAPPHDCTRGPAGLQHLKPAVVIVIVVVVCVVVAATWCSGGSQSLFRRPSTLPLVVHALVQRSLHHHAKVEVFVWGGGAKGVDGHTRRCAQAALHTRAPCATHAPRVRRRPATRAPVQKRHARVSVPFR